MTLLLLLPFQNCGQNSAADYGPGAAKISNSSNPDTQDTSACAQRQTDVFSDSNGAEHFTLSRPTDVPGSIFVTVNGLISQNFTYSPDTVSVQVSDYSDLVAQSQTAPPAAVSITYCNQ